MLLIANRDTLDRKIVPRLITAVAVAGTVLVAKRAVPIWHAVARVDDKNDARRDEYLPKLAFWNDDTHALRRLETRERRKGMIDEHSVWQPPL